MHIRILFFFILLLHTACSSNSEQRLDYALKFAGENRAELEKVLNHYAKDPEKLAAARFLIENMPYHFTKEDYFYSPQKGEYIPNVTQYKDHLAIKKHCDSIKQNGFQFISRKHKDISTIKSDYLIENIEEAFSIREKIWVKNISFQDFCRYILPYRTQIEKPLTIRRDLKERYLPLLDSLKPKNSLEACIIIHEQLKNEIKYQKTGSPLYPTIEDTYQLGFGDCTGLCNLTIAIMRSVGIPVTIDHTLWTKMNLGHSWCTVLHEGVFYCFNPGDAGPTEYKNRLNNTYNRIAAKVYRDRFDPIWDKIKKGVTDDGYISNLKSILNYDVTNEYLGKVLNLSIPIDKEYKNDSPIVYLCTFNCNQWQPLAIGEKKENHYVFDNVVGDNIFIIADSPNGSFLRFISPPFYVNDKGESSKLIPNKEQTFRYAFPKDKFYLWGKYHLYYWDTETQSFSATQLVEKNQTCWIYEGIPNNSLLLFYIPTNNRNRHFFFIENNEIKPWKEEMDENC